MKDSYIDWMATEERPSKSYKERWFDDPQSIIALRNKLCSLAGFASLSVKTVKCVVAHSEEEVATDHNNIATFKLYTGDGEKDFDVPSKPRRLIHVPSSQTHDSVQLKWVEPLVGASNVTSYVVSYYKKVLVVVDQNASKIPDIIRKKKSTNDGTTCTCTIDGLEQGEYVFTVHAECEIGTCESSDKLEIKL